MLDSHGLFLLLAAASAVVGLILLIAVVKLNPFLSLLMVSLLLAAATGMRLETIVSSFETGTGNTLGHIAIVVGLGTMLGKMMAESGASERIAETIIHLFGEKHVSWSMMCAALIVGLPVFFEVGFVLLIPIAFTVARRTGKSLVTIGLPMLAGLSVVHCMAPPHPAAMLAVIIFHADVGRTIVYALLVGIPAAAISGPI
jgi:GntP family gluconate:H+ symporter